MIVSINGPKKKKLPQRTQEKRKEIKPKKKGNEPIIKVSIANNISHRL